MITRLTAGAIPATATVNVQFTYTAKAAELYQFGGEIAVAYNPGKFIHPRDDGSLTVIDMYRMSTNGKLMMDFKEVEWDLFDVQFNLIADLGRALGDLYFQIRREPTPTAHKWPGDGIRFWGTRLRAVRTRGREAGRAAGEASGVGPAGDPCALLPDPRARDPQSGVREVLRHEASGVLQVC